MARSFFVVIDEHDKERFRIFKQNLKNQPKSELWGLPKSVDQELWTQIKKNDMVFLSEKNSTSSIRCRVIKKNINKKLAQKLWPKNPRLKAIDHFLTLDSFLESPYGFYKLANFCGLSPSFEVFSNIYELNKKYLEPIKDVAKQPSSKKSKLKPVTIPIDLDGAPKKSTEKITRFIRDTKKSLLLKNKYKHRCQVCNYRIEISKSKFYSEVHHIIPLKNGGDDNFNNMIVLCPTHHAEFDYNIIGISDDGKTLVDKNGNQIGELSLQHDHKLNMSKIQEYMRGIN